MSENRAVFRNEIGCIYQDDKQGCFVLEYNGYKTILSVPCFFCIKKAVDKIDVKAMIADPDPASDIAIISPHSCDRCFVLTIAELLSLKELFAGAKVMLELNSILQERIYSSMVI
ncbi:hypothetical protein PZB74_12770 [Porifericola rhodea]|uniref:hypothetical protein n=1 Tax=Porifericola rhodea TaxID=930972 RepID=UPI002665381C|nr:hypothetical protein [Porifericola rhodea]WKN29840.1 hypothetical protein PZB74_12770 [Porifericola rhodea]